MLYLFSTELWLSGKPCGSQPFAKGRGRERDPPFQVQPDVVPVLQQRRAPEAESKPSLGGQIHKKPAALREETFAFLRSFFSEKGCQNFIS